MFKFVLLGYCAAYLAFNQTLFSDFDSLIAEEPTLTNLEVNLQKSID